VPVGDHYGLAMGEQRATMNEPWGMVWQAYAQLSPTSRPLDATVAFPFLLAGKQLEAMELGQPALLDGPSLLLGILVGFDDPSPYVSSASREQFVDGLSDLVTALAAPSLETLLLDAAQSLRRHGEGVSRAALVTALKVLPASAMIRSDLIMTTWTMLANADNAQREKLLSAIANDFPPLNLDVIDADAVDILILAYAAALTFLSDRLEERDAFLRTTAVERVRNPAVASRIKYLLGTTAPEFARLF